MCLHNFILRLWAVLRVLIPSIVLISTLTACSLPRVSAEERLFLDVSLDYLGSYELPSSTTVEGTPVRGLSAIAYDRQSDRFYALSDDRSNAAPARFYTLKLTLDTDGETPRLGSIDVEQVTILKNEAGDPYPAGSLDPEGIALSPRQSVFISSEGAPNGGIPPFIDEFDRMTGAWKSRLPIPARFLTNPEADQPQGVQTNRGFEALTLNPNGTLSNWQEPFRLFAATEAPLLQDLTESETSTLTAGSLRFLHYLIGEDLPVLIAEHLYPIDPPTDGKTENGLSELLTLDQGGHFLSLERAYGLTAGFGAKIFQLATGGATDISGVASLNADLTGIQPIRKQLVLDLSTLDIWLDNLEGMTLGPQLPDGSQSLVLISDDNFNPLQTTQVLLFRLNQT